MDFSLLALLTTWKPFAYLAMFFGMMVEGDLLIFTTAFLAHAGIFDLPVAAFLITSGALIGDMAWYRAGKISKNRLPRLHAWAEKLTYRFDRNLLEHTGRTILISKFAYGLHHLILLRAGAIGLNFRKFVRKDIWATLLWVAAVGALGYFSSASLTNARHYLRVTERALLIAVVGFVLFELVLSRIINRNLP